MKVVRLALLTLLAAACQKGEAPRHEVAVRHPRLPEALEAGIAVLPVQLAQPMEDEGRVVSAVSNEVYTSLLVTAEGMPLTAPRDLTEHLPSVSPQEQSLFRVFWKSRLFGPELDPEQCGEVSGILKQRYLLMTRLEEVREEGVEDTATDMTDARFADDVRRQAFSQVVGALVGELVDLWTAEVLWSASVPYGTGKLFEGRGGQQVEQERSRAAFRLAHLIAQSRR